MGKLFGGTLPVLFLFLTGCLEPTVTMKSLSSSAQEEPPATTQPPTSPPTLPDSSFSQIYEVGPGKPLTDPSQVPWESITAGTLVKIYYSPTDYTDKWVISAPGTAEHPVVIRGIPNAAGDRPVISGNGAKTRIQLDYWNEPRSVIKVGGANNPSTIPSHITIENLVIRSAHPNYRFTDDGGATNQIYSTNAASVHIEAGDHITLRNCVLTDSGNGLFIGSAASNIVIESNYIYGNGIVNSVYEHNSYTEATNITFQYNHYGPLREGAKGNSLKDRSAGLTVRYNWMDGGNRCLDLVESDYTSLTSLPAYRNTLVYGNILIKNDGISENGQVIHYGGDGGDTSLYRKGTLWLYHNTVVSYRSDNTTLVALSTNEEKAEIFNNILYNVQGGAKFSIFNGRGLVHLFNNWLNTSWVQSFEAITGSLTVSSNVTSIITGANPLFSNLGARDFTLSASSTARILAAPLPITTPSLPTASEQYQVHQLHRARGSSPILIGAFGSD